jgi:hypothetical protein
VGFGIPLGVLGKVLGPSDSTVRKSGERVTEQFQKIGLVNAVKDPTGYDQQVLR